MAGVVSECIEIAGHRRGNGTNWEGRGDEKVLDNGEVRS